MNNFKKAKHFLLFFYGIIVLCACQQTKQDSNVPRIEVDITSNAELKLSDYFENFRLICLQSDVVMDEIKRIRYDNNQIYVSDGKTMFIFSDLGVLLSHFNRVGGGPREYFGITDFIIDDENIIILDRTSQNLRTYNFYGEFISSQSLDYWVQAISPIIGQDLFLYCGNEHQYKLQRMRNGEINSAYLPVDKDRQEYLHVRSKDHFYKYQDFLYFFELFNDIVYKLYHEGVEPAFLVDYKRNKIPASFFNRRFEHIADFFQEFHKTTYAYGIFDFVASDRYLMFSSIHLKNKKTIIFDKKNGTSQTFSTIKDDVFFDGLTIPISDFNYYADEHIFVLIDAYNIIEWRNTYPLSGQFAKLVNINEVEEEDNPILLIFDFKK
jgi:hypothetical protein